MEEKNLWNSYGEEQLKELHEINEKYKDCLDKGKTERECIAQIGRASCRERV